MVQPAQRRQVEQARSDARRERDRGPEIGFRKSHARHPESAFTQPVCHNKHVCRNPVQIERHFNRFSRSVRREAHQPSPVGPHAPGVVERKLGPAGARTTALGNRIPRGPVRTSRAPRAAQRFADVPIVRLKPFCNLSLSPAAVEEGSESAFPQPKSLFARVSVGEAPRPPPHLRQDLCSEPRHTSSRAFGCSTWCLAGSVRSLDVPREPARLGRES